MNSVVDQSVVRMKDFRDGAGDIAGQVAKTVSSMADQLSDSVQTWSGKAKGLAKSTDGFVRASPWQAVGLVAVAGLLTGLLVSYSARTARSARARDADGETSGG